MGTQTDDVINADLNNKPGFYNNIAGLVQTYRSDSGGVVNSSVIPIIKHINQEIIFVVEPTYLTSWLNATIGFDVGAIYYVFVRWRIKGDTAWTMAPQPNYDDPSSSEPPRFWIQTIKNSSMVFGYFDWNLAVNYGTVPLVDTTIEVDVYFVNIPFP
jgi:hypothetical protein